MSVVSKIPAYNLAVVMRETGIKADTLRAWERRYGLPTPDRSSGGHRLYSQYDIETIKWLIDRQNEGMRINRAVKLWQSIEESGGEPLESVTKPVEKVSPTSYELVVGESLDEFRSEWIAACMAFDEPKAENILTQAFARFPLEIVCFDVLQKGLSQIGELWYKGESTVQQEHFASALAVRRLDALIAGSPAPTREGRILIGCPPDEDHVFSSLIATLLLRRRGWNVTYLGANVPLSKLETAIDSIQPVLVILTAMQLHTAANLYEMAEYIENLGVKLAYGGYIFTQLPELRDRISGYFLGNHLEDIVTSVERIIARNVKPVGFEPVSEEYQIALDHFRDKLPNVNARLWDKVRGNGMKDYHLSIANKYLALDIDAALRLGDISYMQVDMQWLESLLVNYDLPLELLPKYLTHFREALEMELDERGKPIIEWMDNFIMQKA